MLRRHRPFSVIRVEILIKVIFGDQDISSVSVSIVWHHQALSLFFIFQHFCQCYLCCLALCICFRILPKCCFLGTFFINSFVNRLVFSHFSNSVSILYQSIQNRMVILQENLFRSRSSWNNLTYFDYRRYGYIIWFLYDISVKTEVDQFDL